MPRQSFKAPAHHDEAVDLLIGIVELFQVRILLKRLLQRNIELSRDHLGDLVTQSIRKVHDPPYVPDHSLGRHRSERDDLDYFIPAVFFRDIIDHFPAALELEVHVDIRHRNALRVQKSLEEQIIADRIQQCYGKTIGDDTARRRTSAGAHSDPVRPCVIDIIPDDQEIIHVSHPADDAQLILHPLVNGSVVIRVVPGKAFFAKMIQVSPGIISLRDIKVRQFRVPELDRNIAAVGDLLRIFQRIEPVGKQPPHFLFALYVKLPAGITHPVFIGKLLSGLDAQQDIVRLCVIGVCIMAVVGRDQRDPELL